MVPGFLSGFEIIYYKEIDSTNLEGKRLVEEGQIKQNTAIFAENQTSGKGRLDRSWVSFSGNFHASFIIINFDTFANDLNYLYNFLIALCVKDALKKIAKPNLEIKLKWPNDIIINGKKVGGILIEPIIQGTNLLSVIIGVGINVVNYPKGSDILFPATSLKENGIKTTAQNLLNEILENLLKFKSLENFQLIDLFKESAYNMGKLIKIRQKNNEFLEGILHSINENGNLVIKTQSGFKTVSFGDVGN